VKPSVCRSERARIEAVGCVTHASCRFPLRSIPGLKAAPLTLRGAALASTFLKHSDEQTVCALATLAQALRHAEIANVDFTRWGVLAGPRFVGRAALTVALTRYAAEGAWGISPHLIPHRSLHALSGTISQALGIHGPNFGVGGGADGAAEAVLAAIALLADQHWPGVWLVLTGFDPELVPADPLASESKSSPSDCLVVAMALVPAQESAANATLSVQAFLADDSGGTERATFSLESLAQTLAGNAAEASWKMPWGGWITWRNAKATVEMCS
jgi:hypothetical protein